ncbi:leucine-rich repeat protein [Clostridium sp.]
MKKKVLAFLLASTMIIEPFSVASAADFSDGTGQDTVQFSDDAEDIPEVENDDVDQFSTDAVGEGELPDPEEVTVKVGENVNATFYYEYHDDYGTYQKEVKKTVISGVGDMWDYLSDGYDIDNLHENPFWKMGVGTELIVEDGVTSIGSYAFSQNCYNLESITWNDTLIRIGNEAFCGCGIKELNLPNSVKSIGKISFSNCRELETVKLSENIKTIPEYAFQACKKLQKIELPDDLKVIEIDAFAGCQNLENITLPSNLEKLDSGAFDDCQKLKSIVLPSSLNDVGQNIFSGCNRLSTVIFGDGYSNNITWGMFKDCSSLSSITIPVGVRIIEGEAFRGCLRLQEVTIGSNVDTIRDAAFNECDSLKTIHGYTGSYAETFAKNKGIDFEPIGEIKETLQLKNVYCEWQGKEHSKVNVRCTPNKDVSYYVTYVEKGSSAPEYNATKIDGNVRANNQIYANVTDLPEEEVDIYVFVTDDEKNYTSVKVTPDYDTRPEKPLATTFPVKVGENIVATLEGDTLTLTGSGATYDYDASWDDMDDSYVGNQWLDEETIVKIKKIVLGDGITQIGNFAFAGCTNLQEIIFPQKNLKKIKENVFYGCSSLKEFIVPEGVESLGDSSLYGCSSIEKISFPSTLKEIPCFSNGFEGLPKLKSVVLAEGIEKIADGAFCHHKNLKTINLPSTIKEIGEYSFDYSGFVEITIPSNLKKVTRRAFEGDTNLKYVNLEDGVTIIEEDAFRDCTQLQYISIPESVTDIDALAFNGCPNFYIKGKKGSYAEKYANEYKIPFRTGSYKVIFKNNGRTVSTEYADKNESVTPPSLEAKPGYTLSWDADYTNIQEDMVINAVWAKKDSGGGNTTIIVSPSETNKYTVTFKDRGKIVKTEKVKSGDAAEYPYINRNGYELSWDKDFSKVTANITVNAVWTVIKPNKVTSLTAEVQKNSIDLSWDRAENTDYYLVYRKATSDTEYKQIKKTTKILWTDEDVEPGTEYSYKVVGVCSVDGKKYQGADSDIVTAKIGTPQIGDVYSVGDLKYKVTGAKEVSVIGLAKEEVEIKIPSAVSISGKAYKVTSVQEKAFYQNEDIVSIAIGNNVTYVGKYAFYQCPNLETVKFGKRVSVISTCAFTQCSNLENVTLPSSIRRIGAKAFYQCTSIKVLKINGSVLEYVGKKGLAVNKTVTLRLPKKVFTKYQKLIKASSIYSKTKFMKF